MEEGVEIRPLGPACADRRSTEFIPEDLLCGGAFVDDGSIGDPVHGDRHGAGIEHAAQHRFTLLERTLHRLAFGNVDARADETALAGSLVGADEPAPVVLFELEPAAERRR